MFTLGFLLLTQLFPAVPILADEAAEAPTSVEAAPRRERSELDPPAPKNQVNEVRTLLEIYDDDKECGVVTVELHLENVNRESVIRRWKYGEGVKWEEGFFTRFVHQADFNIEGFRPRVFVELRDRPGEVNIRTGIRAEVFLFFADNAPAQQFVGRRVLDTGRGEGLMELVPVRQLQKPGELNGSNAGNALKSIPAAPPLADGSNSHGLFDLGELFSKLDQINTAFSAQQKRSAAEIAKSASIASEASAGRAIFYSKLWLNGSTLKVAFRGGSPDLRRRFAGIASEWTKEANLTLDFGAKGSDADSNSFYEWKKGEKEKLYDIRVSFNENTGSWSAVGTDSRTIELSPDDGSINIPASFSESPDHFRSTVLHEFGHALGLQHVFSHPDADCDFTWDDSFFLFFAQAHGWSKDIVESALRQGAHAWMPLEPSPDSVMMYAFPANLFRQGKNSPWYKAKMLVNLSDYDKQLIRLVYPKPNSEGDTNERKAIDAAIATASEARTPSVATNSFVDGVKLEGWKLLKKNTTETKLEGTGDFPRGEKYRDGLNQSAPIVCRFKARDDFIHSKLGNQIKDQGFGTGFLVGPSLVMTCNHVMPTQDDANSSEVVFNVDRSEIAYSLSEHAIVYSSPIEKLDFSIVRLKRGSDGKVPGNRLGTCSLRTSYDKRKSIYENATRLNIIHYPGGRPDKSFETEGKSLKLVGETPKDKFVAYDALTAGGSSGAPVFNDLWWVVALHRGKQEQDDEPDKFFNEYGKGVRIDMIIESILESKNRDLLSQLSLLDE